MNRTFLSLYFLIIFFIFLMGWGLDALWQKFSPPPALSLAQHDLVAIVDDAIIHKRPLPAEVSQRVTVFTHDDFATSQLMTRLENDKRILLHSSDGSIQLYSLTANEIIRIQLPAEEQHQSSYLYEILLTVFYLSIGLAVFIWVWPLMRDVKKLEQQTQDFGIRVIPEPVHVLPGSAVSNLAHAFNQMAERIKELLASHKEMTYAVSHELRTPLARMKFAIAMLQKHDYHKNDSHKTGEHKNEAATEINDHAQSLMQDITEMDALITQLLTYAGYEQASGPLEQKEGDIAYLIHELIERAQASHRDDGITVDFACAPGEKYMQCDWHLMERAIFNLIHNAMRFAEKTIRVQLNTCGKEYCISVEDDGPGIPEHDMQRVFESFVRLEGKANTQVRGFGLGLAIVKRVMKWHEGSATVTKSPLGGAKFTLAWPKKDKG